MLGGLQPREQAAAWGTLWGRGPGVERGVQGQSRTGPDFLSQEVGIAEVNTRGPISSCEVDEEP